MILLQLFYEFFKVGLFSIGGGLATLPFLYNMSNTLGWFSHGDVANMIAIAESTPGAIGINMSTYAGYQVAGVFGGIVATLGLITPSVIIIFIVARLLKKFKDSQLVQNMFFGLRPASVAMITAAGLGVVKIALVNIPLFEATGQILDIFILPAIILAMVLYILSKKTEWSPIILIAISAVVGVLLYLGGV